MLLGTYYHSLEAKRRVMLPKQLRVAAKEWVVTRGFDGCLFIFPSEIYTKEMQKLEESSFTKKGTRDITRLLAGDAQVITPDSYGRVQLPEYLSTLAGLKKELVVVGAHSRVEIWDRDRYHQYRDELDAQAEEIAEKAFP
ncbi:MAG: division/cell wall cluster transcriptional repressor MraZ [Pseudomonadales bacterium]|nr:division/cell wall cluster transcriptional repressor MraZ [Candidatus Woesebacteria bacterium]MCB9802148.1 division/cell wall cluster transcriptional repressor MraZ [Pseudomonadales bacterium]